MPKKELPSRFVTARTFANAIGIARVTAKRWMINGQVETERVGDLRYILATEITRHRELRKAERRNAPQRRKSR